MVAYLRYKRIPYEVIWSPAEDVLKKMNIEPPKPILLPVFILDRDGQPSAVTDSTPLIREFEEKYPHRSVLPKDPALNFINFILEDFGDEWCTKFMFHYRWNDKKDAENAGTILPLQIMGSIPDEVLDNFNKMFSKRQIDRLWVVGSNKDTAPIIDASLRRLLVILQKHFTSFPYLIGKRPSSSDFALFGQFSQLVNFDPTPREIVHEVSMRTVAWVGVIEDLSGLEVSDNDWFKYEDIPSTIKELLTEIGKGYVPALLANAKAIENEEKEWETEIDGCIWRQKSFPYQAKCLKWINEEYNMLSKIDMEKVDNLLDGTGCEKILNII
jgi:glutathione S-transferase